MVGGGAGGLGGDGGLGVGLTLSARTPAPPPPGIIVQGAGSSAFLQFSSDGLHWHNYTDILPGILPPAKVWLPEPPEPVTHHASLWVPPSLSLRAFQSP